MYMCAYIRQLAELKLKYQTILVIRQRSASWF